VHDADSIKEYRPGRHAYTDSDVSLARISDSLALVPNRLTPKGEKFGGSLSSSTGSGLSSERVYEQDAFRHRMQRLEELVSELNKEIALGGDTSIRVAELRGRIYELTREDTMVAAYVSKLSKRNSAIPPPYDADTNGLVHLTWDGREDRSYV
jgi:hypothetical protein